MMTKKKVSRCVQRTNAGADLFAFLESQFAAAFGLLLHLAVIVTLRLIIRAERGMDLFGDDG